MQNPSEELNKLHQELTKFHDQIEIEQDIDVWAKRSQKIKTLLQKTKALLPSKTEKEQQRFFKLQKYLAAYKTPQKVESAFKGFEHITFELLTIFFIPFSISIWLGLSIIGGILLFCLFVAWRARANKQNILLSKLREAKRDARYLSNVVEYEYLNRKAT